MAKKETAEDILRSILEKGGRGAKGQEALQAAADALKNASNNMNQNSSSQKKSSDNLNKAASSINKAADKLAKNQEENGRENLRSSRVLDSVQAAMGDISDAFKSFFNDTKSFMSKDTNVSERNRDRPGRQVIISKQFLENLLDINKGILRTSKTQTGILLDILDALSGKKRDTTADRRNAERRAGGNKPPPPKGPGGGGPTFGGPGGFLAGLGAAGAGLGAFFLGLAGSEAIMEKFGNGENIKSLLTNLAEGLGAFETRDLVALAAAMGVGAVAGGAGASATGMATGIGAIGFGIGAFFTGLAAGDKTMSWIDTDMESLKKATKGLSEALANLDVNALTIVGGLLAAGGAAGALFGPTNMAEASIGMGAIGLGIGAFFGGLAAGDKAMSWMNTDGEKLKSMAKNLSEAISAFTKDPASLAVLGGLLGAGGAAGALFGPTNMAEASIGMAAVGLGIGGFFAGLGAGDKALSWMNTDGEKLKLMMKNLQEGISAFTKDPASLAVLGTMLGTGALFGVAGPEVAGMAGLGMTLIGAGIAGFFGAFAAVDKLASWMGADGSTLKTVMGNLAGGLSEFAKLKDVNLLSIAGGLAALGPAIVAFLGTQGIASLAESVTDKVKGAWNYLFGSDEEGNKKKSKIEQIVDSLTPLKNLQDIDLTSLDKLSDAIAKFVAVANSLVDLPKISFDSTFKPTLDALLQTLPYLDVLAHGGEIITPYVPGSGRSGKPQNNKIVIKKGLLDKNLGLDEMMDAVSKIRAIVGDTSTLQTTTAVPNGQLNKTQQVNGAATDEQASPSSVVVQGGYQPKVAGRPEIIQSPPPKLTGAVSTAPVPSLLERHMYDRAYFGAGYP